MTRTLSILPETDTEAERILAMIDEEVRASSTPEEIGWGKGYKEGLRVALKVGARVAQMREALELADAALRGADMNMAVVERKIAAALSEQEGK